MSTSTLPTIALFGATGGCITHLLSLALTTSQPVRCLVRTPSKLATLASQHPNLTLIKGDIYDHAAIRDTLVHDGRVVDIVVSGIGMVPVRNGLKMGFSDEHVCENVARNIGTVLEGLEREDGVVFPGEGRGPRCVFLSTTGISDVGQDVPLLMQPFYKLVLGTPHRDKKAMEGVVREGRWKRWVLVRPSLLVDGQEKGVEKVRVGVEMEGVKGVDARGVGYVIGRKDVGSWIFEECVKSVDATKWEGKIVSLTY